MQGRRWSQIGVRFRVFCISHQKIAVRIGHFLVSSISHLVVATLADRAKKARDARRFGTAYQPSLLVNIAAQMGSNNPEHEHLHSPIPHRPTVKPIAEHLPTSLNSSNAQLVPKQSRAGQHIRIPPVQRLAESKRG